METIFVTTPFPPALEHKARLEAAKRRISRAELVRLAVADFLERLEQPPVVRYQETRCER